MQHRDNLANLRNWMLSEQVSALYIPREDMFGGEYVAPCDELLDWVSGFSGSAGFAIITLNQAHLFVDGRYTLQAKHQAPDFEIHELSQPAIGKVFQELDSLHFDPWLMSVKRQQSWQEYIHLVPLKANPIDELWTDRPKVSHSPAYAYSMLYAGVTHQEKLECLGGKTWLLSNPESVCWLLNIRGHDLPYVPVLHCMALITNSTITLYCEPEKIPQDLAKQLELKVVPFALMASDLKSQKTEISADKRTTPSALLNAGIEFNWHADPCELPKAKKNFTEQQGMINCHVRDAVAVIRFWRWLEKQDGITEIQAQDHLESCRQQMDLYQGPSFATISAFAAHGAIVHYRAEPATNSIIGRGIYLLDSGGQYLDGTTDITRTFAIGTPAREQIVNYTLVLKGHIALANIHFPIGTTGVQLDALARQYLWQHGLDYAHGTGHGVGSYLNVHEGPQGISKARNAVLEPGMVVSNEPGLYIDGSYGIRIENLQMVKPSPHANFLCFESLTLVPYDSALIDQSMLTQQELSWLTNYYQVISQNILPVLHADERAWSSHKLKI